MPGPTFFGTFSVFGQSKSARSDGLLMTHLMKIGMSIFLTIWWRLDSEGPVPGGELPRAGAGPN